MGRKVNGAFNMLQKTREMFWFGHSCRFWIGFRPFAAFSST